MRSRRRDALLKVVQGLRRFSSFFRQTECYSFSAMSNGFVGKLLILLACIAFSWSIPASLVDEIKSTEIRENKVKRASVNAEQNHQVPYFNKPSAIKRGTNIKNPNTEQQVLNEWSQLQDPSLSESLSNIQSSLYNQQGNIYDDKTLAEYEKGFQFGANKDKLDEDLENAVLKSEYYGEPTTLNQYRYYGAEERRRRKRRAHQKLRLKREVDLTPDEIYTILSLYEKNRQPPESSYRQWLEKLENHYGDNFEDSDGSNNDENWLETPVYPHITTDNLLEDSAPNFEKRGRWGNYSDKKKRFMVAKKRNDPTRELRYLNGPNQNDYYVLSQLLSNQRDPDVPLYRRLVL